MICASEQPIVEDPELRRDLIEWFTLHAESWHRQADGAVVYGAALAEASFRARAAVCEQFARELQDSARPIRYPEAWTPFIQKKSEAKS